MKLPWTILVTLALLLGACTPQTETPLGYTVQISSGTWHQANYSASQIIHRLDTVTALVPVDKVIIGWNLDPNLYQTVGEYLHSKNIQMLFWLPVFAETQEVCPHNPAMDLWGQVPQVEIAYCEGFQFHCPTDTHHIQHLITLWENQLASCGFDGVFLDRIRTHSFVAGISGVLNCGCPSCATKYQEQGISLDRVRHAVEEKGDAFFNVSGYDPQHGFTFSDSLAAAFFQAKGRLIGANVATLADYFHQHHLQVGMDLYAPLLAQFVGQDYAILSQHADFIKPMLYRRTYAPAGIGYEQERLRQSIPHAQGYTEWEMDTLFLKGQLQALSSLPCKVYPGLEINYYPHTAPTSPDYIRESLRLMQSCGCHGAVLSWDIMQAPNEHIRAINDDFPRNIQNYLQN